MKSVVVTGASTGIGEATCRVLVRHAARVFGSVRRHEDGERLRGELGESFVPIVFDITDEAAVHRGAERVGALLDNGTLWGLVNNAGVALPAPLLHQPISEFRQQLEINVVGALAVTQAFAPLLGSDRSRTGPPGRIINMSSVAGRFGMPFLGAYAASKHALEGLSDSLRRELMAYGIDVIVIGPGAIATPIWDKAEAVDLSAYESTDYGRVAEKMRAYMLKRGRGGLRAEKVGEVVWEALNARNPRVRYAVVGNRLANWTLPMVLPKRMIDRAIARQLGWTRR